MLLPLVVISVVVALISVTTYIPFKNHLRLHGAYLDNATLRSPAQRLNLDQCQPVAPRLPNQAAGPSEPSFCEDIVLDSRTGMAYLSCDPSRLTWDARAGIFGDSGSSLHAELGEPAIWAWDTTQARLPRRLYISSPPAHAKTQAPVDLKSTFHPLGIAVTASNPYYIEEVEDEAQEQRGAPPANLVLVANHPYADKPGVIDVFVHDLDKVGGKDNAALRWIKRIEGEALQARLVDTDLAYVVNPFRLAVFAEQYSEPQGRDYAKSKDAADAAQQMLDSAVHSPAELAAKTIRVPSILITSLPDPKYGSNFKQNKRFSALYTSFWEPFAAVFLQSYAKQSPDRFRKIFLHHSNIDQTLMTRFDGGEPAQWDTFPPVFQTWDGNGKKGGSNSSTAAIFIPSLSSDTARVQEWEQHWVRGISGGIRQHTIISLPSSSDSGEIKRLINTYTPSFINFFSAERKYPIRALAVDTMGRYWTAGNLKTKAVEDWIAYQRSKRRLETKGPPVKEPARPAAEIQQTTYVYRHLGNVLAHPWDFDQLSMMKKRGIWLNKEYHTFDVFRSPDESLTEVKAKSKEQLELQGFLPTVPTGLAVDLAGGYLYVTGAYEERGIARCKLPSDWAEL